MDEDSFNKLLNNLSPDRDQAAVIYEKIRQKLTTFFRCQCCYSSEDCTDLTFDRVAQRISKGVELDSNKPYSFFYGVARNVLHEYRRRQVRQYSQIGDISPIDILSQKPYKPGGAEEKLTLEQQLRCLEHCLNELPAQNRLLILEYYHGEANTKIKNRDKLAKQLGVPINSLRIRALRIRQKLKACVIDCLKQLLRA